MSSAIPETQSPPDIQDLRNAAAGSITSILNRLPPTDVGGKTTPAPDPPTDVGGKTTPAPDPILTQARALANQDIASQVNPLQAQVGTLGRQESAAAGAIKSEFASILPSVADSASRLEQANSSLLNDSQAVYQQAGQQLNTIQQNNAAYAQQTAQQIGGPVSVGAFTSASDPYQAAMTESGNADALRAANTGITGNTTAETFAGQVFPALATEQQAQNRQYYQDQVKQLQTEIDKIQATKGTLISSNYAKLQSAQFTHQLDVAKLKLQQANDATNWANKQRQLDQADQKITLEEDALKQAGYYKGVAAGQAQTRLQQAEARITDSEKIAWARIGLSQQQMALRAAHYTETDALAKQRNQINLEKNAMAMVTAATTPGGGKPVSLTTRVDLQPGDPLVQAAMSPSTAMGHVSSALADVHRDPKTGQWYEYKKMTLTPQQWAQHNGMPNVSGITDPNRLYQLLIANHTPPAMAKSIVSLRPETPKGWAPGQKSTYTAADLAKMTLAQVEKIAETRGYTGSGSKQRAIDFVTASNP